MKNETYEEFTNKFKPKLTTDDCYTPDNVYKAVADWCCKEYGFTADKIVRPFYPGGDFESYDYPEGCVVVDNPPFSILAKIIEFYSTYKIKYFLFAPSLTCLSNVRKANYCAIITDTDITYANGAVVRTAFITNLEPDLLVRTAPKLQEAVKAENDKNAKAGKAELPKYIYPDAVLTAAAVQRWAHQGIDYKLKKTDAVFISALDSQRAQKKTIFGGGFLLSERAAAERAAAERAAAERTNAVVWKLSEREKEMQKLLEKKNA